MPEEKKKLILGVDEAGYGSNLGPFVIGGSAWIIPEQLDETSFTNLLVQEQFECRTFSTGCSHLPIGDSKKLYRAGDSLQSLEVGLLAMLGTIAQVPANVAELISLLGSAERTPKAPPWYFDLDHLTLPERSDTGPEISRLSLQASQRLIKNGISLVAVATSVIAEPEFNEQVKSLGSKGLLLSQSTFRLISRLLKAAPGLSVEIFCDRQGGRTNYMPVLMDWQPDIWFTETRRTKLRCSYQSTDEPKLQIHFTIGGDNFAPTSLASMAAKYLRERLMKSFNDFWSKHVPGLRPTAGYPVDAARFRNSIEKCAEKLGLFEDQWWRCR